MNKTLAFGLTVIAGTTATSLQAQEIQDTMVVVGSRTPTEISQIPGTVWVVEKEELQQQIAAGGDLKAALGKLVPGLDFAPQGRTNYGQNMRGRSVQVLIDGVSMNGSRSLSRQFDSIDPFNIERVEVISGASSLYGGGATGGIINIITRKGELGGLKLRTQTGITTGFNDSSDLDYRLAQSASGGNERVQGYIGVAYQDNGRHFDAGGNEIFPDIFQTDLQDNRSIDVLGNLTFNIDANQTLDIGAQLYRSGYEGERGVYFPNLDAAPANLNDAEIRDGYRSDRDPATDRKMVNLQYHHADLLGQDFYLQAFHREEEASFQAYPDPFSNYQFRASKQNTELSGIKGLFDAQLSDNIGLTYGLDLTRDKFDANRMIFNKAISDASGGLVQEETRVEPHYPGYQVDGIAAFTQADWQATEGLKLSAGVRQQRMDVEVDDFYGIPGGKNDYDATLFNASALYDYGNGHQNWLRYSQGFELPDPAKYYGKDPEATVADNPLSAIETDQVELGWRYSGGNWMTQAAIYYAWSDKAVEYDRIDKSVNVVDDKKRDYGFEGAVTRYFDNGFEAGGTLHLVRSEQKNDDGDWEKRDATISSLSSATAFVGWSDLIRSARLQANHAFDLEDDNDQKIEGYTTLDLLLSQQTDFGKLSLGVQNLLDKQYTTVWGQRATIFYFPTYGPEELYDYQGRGRTYSLTWSHQY